MKILIDKLAEITNAGIVDQYVNHYPFSFQLMENFTGGLMYGKILGDYNDFNIEFGNELLPDFFKLISTS